MAAPKPQAFGSAALGMDVRSDETALPDGALRDIRNFDVDNAGVLHTRRGATRLSNQTGAHSLWSPLDRRAGFYARGQELRMLTADLVSTLLLAGLKASDRVRFAESADAVFFTNGGDIGVIEGADARLLGVPVPDSPDAVPIEGGLQPGRYGFAATFVDARGEESGLSPVWFADTATGGLRLSLPPAEPGATALRVYMTPTNGDELYQVAEVPAGWASVDIQGQAGPGKRASTQFQARMPAGDDICHYNGRLFVSRGTVIRYSEPYAYGRTDPRFNYLDLRSPIRFIAAVDDGIYAGTNAGTVFISGSTPKDFAYRVVGPAPVATGSIMVPASIVGGAGRQPVVAWLGTDGFSIGAPGGAVKSEQSQRIALAEHGRACLVALPRGGIEQIVSLVDSTAPATLESASDSTVIPIT